MVADLMDKAFAETVAVPSQGTDALPPEQWHLGVQVRR